jgi:hypothetical protein
MDFDDDIDDGKKGKRRKGDDEFECPECNAHNPLSDPLVVGNEVQCFYCGVEYKVLDANGKFKFKAT